MNKGSAKEEGSERPVFSVVILTRNRAQFLPKCLESVLSHKGPKREVLVFDNGSTDNTSNVVNDFPVEYFLRPDSGLAEMRQEGLERSEGEFVVMCDDDCTPHEGWLDAFLWRFLADEKIALVGGKINNVGFEEDCEKGIGYFGENGLITLGTSNSKSRTRYFGAANLAIRKKLGIECGGFDPFLVCAYEEGDLACKLVRSGYEIEFEKNAAVDHHNIKSSQRNRFRFRNPDVMRLYFFLTHFRPKRRQWIRFLFREMKIQARIILKWRKPGFFQRVIRVISTIFQVPGIIVKTKKMN